MTEPVVAKLVSSFSGLTGLICFWDKLIPGQFLQLWMQQERVTLVPPPQAKLG